MMNNDTQEKSSNNINELQQEEIDEEESGREKNTSGSATVASNSTVVGKQIYENNVAKRALQRGNCGNNPQRLKGIAHEVMFQDKQNINPKNILTGKKASQTLKTNAVRDDLLVKQGRSIVKREQLKDTISPSGISKTIKQAKEHKYQRTNLYGTVETTAKYNEAASQIPGGIQQMKSTGISSEDTARIAKKAIGVKDIKNEIPTIAKSSQSAAKGGAAVSAIVETVNSGIQVANGDKTVTEAAVSVANEAAIGATTAAVSDATATATTILLATTPAAPVAGPVGIAAGAGAGYITDKTLRNSENVAVKKYMAHIEKKEEFKRKEAELRDFEITLERKRAKRVIGNKNVSKKTQDHMNKLNEATTKKNKFKK